MATRITFVSEQYMRDNLPISRNLDTKDIQPNIQMAEELFIQDILGSVFYEYLYSGFTAQTLSPNEITLVQEYIKPAEANRALKLALPFLQYQVKNKGAQRQNSEFSESADLTQLKFLISEVADRAQFYEQRLVKYLCINNNLFPQYTMNNDGVIKPNPKNGWNQGLIFY